MKEWELSAEGPSKARLTFVVHAEDLISAVEAGLKWMEKELTDGDEDEAWKLWSVTEVEIGTGSSSAQA